MFKTSRLQRALHSSGGCLLTQCNLFFVTKDKLISLQLLLSEAEYCVFSVFNLKDLWPADYNACFIIARWTRIVCFQMVPFLQPAQSLLVPSYSSPADPTPRTPILRPQRGNPREETPPRPRSPAIFWWRKMWAELESTEKEGITIQGHCIYNLGQLQLVTAFLHVADRAKPQRFLCWIKDSPQTRTSTPLLKIT